ncbi:hypothetical protein BURPS305_0660 [Burkholderia pseudomallei 305]|nr:hypothetical protein BURPS305_0660 [Burkholderia pseudomallei 305]
MNRGERGRFRRADGPCARARGVRRRAALGRAARRHGGGSRRLIEAINRSGRSKRPIEAADRSD